MEAFVSAPIEGNAEAQADAWFLLCERRMGTLLDEAGDGLTLYSGGALADPTAGIDEKTWQATRAPADFALSFGPDTHYGASRSVAASPNADSVGTTTTLLEVEDSSHIGLRCQAFGFPHAGPAGVARALRDIIAEYAETFPVDFGNVAPDNTTSRTVLERALKRPEPTARAEARRVLRGYSWITLVPASLAPVVIPRLESSAKLTWRVLATVFYV